VAQNIFNTLSIAKIAGIAKIGDWKAKPFHPHTSPRKNPSNFS
jgi:hypothetical protein